MLFRQNARKTGNNAIEMWPALRYIARFERFTDLNLFKYAFNVIQNWNTDALQFYSIDSPGDTVITFHLPPKPLVTTSLFYSSRTAVFLSNFTPEDWYIVSLLIFIRLAYLSVVPHFH